MMYKGKGQKEKGKGTAITQCPRSLVPKLYLGTLLSPQLRCPRPRKGRGSAVQLPTKSRPQVQLGNEKTMIFLLRSRRPERAAINQPRVETRACPSFYPGFASPTEPTLKGLNRRFRAGDSTLTGLAALAMRTQGRRCCANPGLNDHDPVGVVAGYRRSAPNVPSVR
jgi:hypothetical protein